MNDLCLETDYEDIRTLNECKLDSSYLDFSSKLCDILSIWSSMKALLELTTIDMLT